MRILPLVLLVPLTTGCLFLPLASGAGPTNTPRPTGAELVGVTFVPTARPTSTEVPTRPPFPSATLAPPPTAIPTRAATLPPPPTQIPTFTPRPTATLAPVVFTGRGDDVVSVKKGDEPALLRISYAGSSNFAVWNYDAAGSRIDLLVNKIGAYKGLLIIDSLDNSPPTARLEVKGTGAWQIELLPLSAANKMSVPGALVGKGDDVVLLSGGKPDLMKISHLGSSNFAVWSYASRRTLLVNDIGAYTGTKPLDAATFLLAIHADGAWNLSITAR